MAFIEIATLFSPQSTSLFISNLCFILKVREIQGVVGTNAQKYVFQPALWLSIHWRDSYCELSVCLPWEEMTVAITHEYLLGDRYWTRQWLRLAFCSHTVQVQVLIQCELCVPLDNECNLSASVSSQVMGIEHRLQQHLHLMQLLWRLND